MKNIPVLTVEAETIAEAYEKALIKLYNEGCRFKTQYDKPEDPESIDATMNITVLNPLKDPMIHKAFPGGIEDLREYVMELEGAKNHWCKNINDPDDTRWEYTYNQRFTQYGSWKEKEDILDRDEEAVGYKEVDRGFKIDQVSACIEKLIKQPFTRQAQIITWMPNLDLDIFDPPCFLAGTKILTPKGSISVEKLKNGDAVYSFDISTRGLVIDKVSNFFKKNSRSIKIKTDVGELLASEEQLILIKNGNKEEWMEAKRLGEAKKRDGVERQPLVFYPSSTTASEISDMMLVGFMHGDGWLGGGFNHSRKRPIKRWDVSFSIHPDANDAWCLEYIKKHTDNKIQNNTRFVVSDVVDSGGLSKKIVVGNKMLWQRLEKLGCPVGSKIGQKIKLSANSMTIQDGKDFLTGIYSAEGCIYFDKHKNNRPSIQLGMAWLDCVIFISKLLDKIGIRHVYCESPAGVYKIYIDDYKMVKKALDSFDFRMDSRKQAKFLKLKAMINVSERQVAKRHENVLNARKYKRQGKTNKWVSEKVENFHVRWNKAEYKPSFRWIDFDCEIENCGVWLPVRSVESIGKNDVYDFEVKHYDHAIVANGMVAHNCLQNLWFRMSEENGEYWLNTNIRFRSNDAWGAFFMNLFGLTLFIKEKIADVISERTGKKVNLGRINWQADSWHIYGKDIAQAKARLFERIPSTSFDDRVYNFNDDMIREIYNEATPVIEEKIRVETEKM